MGVAEEEQISLRVACLNLYCVTSRKTRNAAPMAALTHFNAIRIGAVKICEYWGLYWGPYWRPWPYW